MTAEEKIIIAFSKEPIKNREILDQLKRKFAKKEKSKMAPNSLLLKSYHSLIKEKRIQKDELIEYVLRIRKIRSLSGIVVVSVLTKPYACPGKCLYCPEQAGAPKSYLKEEPAVARAIKCNYHPYQQVQLRIRALESIGHPTDKIDLRLIGATWSFYPKNYQTWFIKECFRAANNMGKPNKLTGAKLIKLQKQNEKAKHRIIGITIETRPDFIDKKEIKRLRELGVTRVELGVQSIYNNILKLNERGHNIGATIEATKLLKDAGFKICYQMMPNLLGSNVKKDIKMFGELFSNSDFCPDYLKIYPCALLKEAPLYNVWKTGDYKPYTTKQLLSLLIKIKQLIPYYCRIQRIIRDIPSSYIVEGGTKISNLRQMITKISKEEGWRCKCIRCREIKEKYDPKEKLYLFRIDYDASDGKEIFLSFENKNRTHLFSLLRLRIPGQTVLPVLKNAAIIRELHTYGQLVPVSGNEKAAQHKGLGKKLMKEAEKIAKKEFHFKKIAVISGVGVKNYYRKLDYRLKDTYMIKTI
ncbi:MAG: tRNA uridine(34) 5-carboxymethylaminomethyl modification radical SAM/GNAT enzyme Elp3 [Patescibacteria group bacterium]|nr:tRNA uridine(34) 5-carboxymethylaminomethyl modification radical SAM/GNAT enzyme Elp3 [Patescibacteria group bacterium]